jgi:hypothetical protein
MMSSERGVSSLRASDAQCLIQRSSASPYFVRIHRNNKPINIANIGCKRTRKGFFLSIHIRHANASAVRQTKKIEVTIMAINLASSLKHVSKSAQTTQMLSAAYGDNLLFAAALLTIPRL